MNHIHAGMIIVGGILLCSLIFVLCIDLAFQGW